MDLDSLIAGAVSSAVVVGGICAFAGRKFVERTVTHYFNIHEERIAKELEIISSIRGEILRSQLRIYERAAPIVYKSRNTSRDLIEGRDDDLKAVSNLETLTSELTDTLFDAELYLDREIFDDLHAYKLLLQRILSESSGSASAEPGTASLAAAYAELDGKYKNLIARLQSDIKEKTEWTRLRSR